ncbi:rab-GTPase-TBC domain-containing protein [Cokeromyces recurvatus]|uniref:rab-GTPase-TBC domain-containing protein n=1 Tax=Cokeromyces recurvatus TaxID=90255 RepID=UPI00221FDB55|nr:rab-GTPase-TBC domain-containing protein [Cokeromyces recurvatus]KAI7901356.1 rab-GTPase-TBC domain-containing protein [Cokeromyces recurvatus]
MPSIESDAIIPPLGEDHSQNTVLDLDNDSLTSRSTDCKDMSNNESNHNRKSSDDNEHIEYVDLSSSLSSFNESASYFEKPLRTLSQDTISTTPSISEEQEVKNKDNESHNPLKIITSALVSGKKPEVNPVPIPTRINNTRDAIYETTVSPGTTTTHHVRESVDNESISSISTAKSVFALWSPFRSSFTTNSTSLISSRRPSTKQNSTSSSIKSISSRPSASFAARQKRLSRPTSIISPLPGFQEALLAQMEQLNTENTNDPKSKAMKNLKRQSIKQSLVSQNKGDEYDWDFWAGIMCDYQNLNKVNKDLIKQIRFGIPPSIRGMVWQLLTKSKNEDLVLKYMELLKLQSPYDKMIQRDLARTFPGHTYFKETDGQGQGGLYNVVRAYSLYDNEVGYCQGLAFIVGPMLLNMPDEDAFCLLVQLMNNKYGIRGHFTPEMDGLQLRLYQFDNLLQEYLPHISRHLKEQGINSTMYASQWFMTLFAYKFPLDLVFRIYDVIFTEGISSIFKFALALLKRNQTAILGFDFEHLLDFLKNGLFKEYKDDDRRFVHDACELEIPLKRLTQLEKEHKLQLQKELVDAQLIDELQKSNIKLEKQLKSLETNVSTLKQEHQDINGQLSETLNQLNLMKEEGNSLRTLVLTLQNAVNTLPEKIESKTKDDFENLCEENASLIGKNSALEDQLQKMETSLIDFKIRYAQSENEKEELHRKLYELKKKLMSF